MQQVSLGPCFQSNSNPGLKFPPVVLEAGTPSGMAGNCPLWPEFVATFCHRPESPRWENAIAHRVMCLLFRGTALAMGGGMDNYPTTLTVPALGIEIWYPAGNGKAERIKIARASWWALGYETKVYVNT